ncbi:hypothetical protein V1527DRAFT_519594 [Lipomyces starkeyi]
MSRQCNCVAIRNDIFDCSGTVNGPEFILTCSRSQERKTERGPVTVQRYTTMKEFFACRGELRIAFSKLNQTATITYDHKCHTKRKHSMSPTRYSKLHSITRQQVYNIWLSFSRQEWERDAANGFRSAQLLLEGQEEGYRLIEGLQEPEVSFAFIIPCFSDSRKLDHAKMTEVFIHSTFGTSKHGFELFCVLTEYDFVSLPLSYLLLDTRKRGTRLTARLTALRAAGLNPNVVHTDKDFAPSLQRNNDRHNHHLCLWHSLRAIHQYITGKMKSKGFDTIENTRNSTRLTALPQYLHFLSVESDGILSNGQSKQCTQDQARTLRAMIKRHLLRHPLLPKPFFDSEGTPVPEGLQYQTYEEIHSSSIKERLEYCNNWLQCYDTNFPDYNEIGKSLENPQEGLCVTIR